MSKRSADLESVFQSILEGIDENQIPPGGIGLHEPIFRGNEEKYLKECLQTTLVSSIGPFVSKFEQMLVEYTGVPYAVACSSGTAALHVCLILAGVRANDEVLMPAVSFVATANAAVYCQAIPHFVDVESKSFGIDAVRLRSYLQKISVMKNGECYNEATGRRIKVLVPMHCFGHPVDLDQILSVAQEFNLVLIEDAAESLGSFYKGKHTGSHGLLSALSFNGNKVVTTGGGGAILTHSKELAVKAKHLTTTAKIPHAWKMAHDEVGYNYRLPNLNAALGCAQLEQLPRFLKAKRQVAERYLKAFEDYADVKIVHEPDSTQSNYWLVNLLIDSTSKVTRDQILERTNQALIRTRPSWELLPDLAMYRECPKMELTIARNLVSRTVSLPSSVSLGH